MSATSLSKLISTRKEELARLLEWRGTNFPVVERQNDLRISFIELELEDLEKLNNHPQLNEYQQIVLEWLKEEQTKNPELTIFGTLSVLFDESENRFMSLDVIDALIDLSNSQQAGVFQAFSKWALEQEEE